MTFADLHRPAEPSLSAEPERRRRSRSIVSLAVVLCCAVIGLDQILHTTPASFAASPLNQLVHWGGDVVLAVPFAAIALWAGGWLGSRLGISMTSKSGVFAQACVITLVFAVMLVPAWFAHYAIDSLAPSGVAPVAAAAEHAGHAGHDHGGAAPVIGSWVGTWVLYLLMSIPLAAAAVCVAQRAAGKLSIRQSGESDVILRAIASAGAVVLGLGLGWFLESVASQSSGLVTYANALSVVHLHHLAHAHLSAVSAVVVQHPFGYQLATAAQDALAGQAVGLPVTCAGLLWLTRAPGD